LVTEWKKFDLNGDEIIQVREVEKFLSSLKVNMPADKRAELIKALDTNGDGTVSFIEFVHLYNSPGFKQYKYYTNRA
jgi:Ca2+-binding EF-hand superfamily protein